MTAPAETPEPPGPAVRFRALWPVINADLPAEHLLAEAQADLPAVARRYGARSIVWHDAPVLREGRSVPGSGGAAHVVTIDALVRLTTRAAARLGAAT